MADRDRCCLSRSVQTFNRDLPSLSGQHLNDLPAAVMTDGKSEVRDEPETEEAEGAVHPGNRRRVAGPSAL